VTNFCFTGLEFSGFIKASNLHCCSFGVIHGGILLWHVDPSLGNDREISNYTTGY
jgi:hypothetical protein